MQPIRVEVSSIIPAAPKEVYHIFADYRNEHPKILPAQYFRNLVVEEGGYGAGTVVHVQLHVFGVVQEFHLVITEPTPGEVLAETDQLTGQPTWFIVKSIENNPEQSHVTIATDWTPRPGPAGWLARLTTPFIMRRIYRAELAQLAEYVQSREKPAQLPVKNLSG